jgi:hypothetical protein
MIARLLHDAASETVSLDQIEHQLPGGAAANAVPVYMIDADL